MKSRTRAIRLGTALVVALVAIACTSDSDESGSDPEGSESEVSQGSDAPEQPLPSRNPNLADSVVPMAHFDAAQTDSVAVSGPDGPTLALTEDDLTYQHLGPAHFGIAISPEYADGRRVIWSNGGDRISKLDYETLEVLAELPLPDKGNVDAATADGHISDLDAASGEELADISIELAANYLRGLAGVYYLLDDTNTLFVGGPESVIAYGDVDPDDPDSEIEVVREWSKPAEIGGVFVGANITQDGRLALVTDEGWTVAVTRDFTEFDAIQLTGAEAAPAHNAAMADAGQRKGSADWVRNSLAVDEEGGIYAVSLDHVHKVIWTGEDLSVDTADGAWTAEYSNSTGVGSGATPSLMGFGEDDDKFVVLTDGDEVMNVVLMWRDEVPEDWTAPDGAPDQRIAGQQPANVGDPDIEAIQTEQSVVVGGWGAMVVNNDPASVPEGYPEIGHRLLSGYAGADPAFAPHGIQKFAWDPDSREFAEQWVNTEVSSANSVPVVSLGSDIVYTVGAREGEWGLEALDWTTGESAFHWTTGSNRYNTLFSGMNLDQDGRVIHTTPFGVVRYEPEGNQ